MRLIDVSMHSSSYSFIVLCRMQWQPTPVLLPGKSQGRKSLVGYSPWGCKESDTTEWLRFHFSYLGHGVALPHCSSRCSLPLGHRPWPRAWVCIYILFLDFFPSVGFYKTLTLVPCIRRVSLSQLLEQEVFTSVPSYFHGCKEFKF